MLTVISKLKPSGSTALGYIARELAFTIAMSAFEPTIHARHIAGITNTTADVLSRRFAPRASSETWSLPPEVGHATESFPPERNSDYYLTGA
jgi:hypothetical protein